MWPASRRSDQAALAAYWAALVRGEPTDELARLAAPLPSDLVATIARMRAGRHTPRPDPAFVARLERDLLHALVSSPAGTAPLRPSPPLRHSPPIAGNGRAAPRERRPWLPDLPIPKQRRRWAVAQVATAMLLIATLVATWFAFRPDDRRVVAPVVGTPQAVPTPTPGVDIAELLVATLPGEAIPGAGGMFGFARYTFDPGTSLSIPSMAPERSVAVDLVVDGAYAIRSAGALRIDRAGGSAEDVPPGTETNLGPGDVALRLDNAAAQSSRNPGSGPLVLVRLHVFSSLEAIAIGVPQPPPQGVSIDRGPTLGLWPGSWAQLNLQAGPVTASLWRLTLAPAAALPLAPENFPTLRFVESGRLGVEIVAAGVGTPPGGSSSNLTRYPAGSEVRSVPPMPGTEFVLRNMSETQPLVLLEVAFIPVGGAAASPATHPG